MKQWDTEQWEITRTITCHCDITNETMRYRTMRDHQNNYMPLTLLMKQWDTEQWEITRTITCHCDITNKTMRYRTMYAIATLLWFY